MAKYELAVDLGSSHITIFLKGSGLVLREPTIAAVVKQKNKFEIIESGFQAKNLMTRSLGGARLVFPEKRAPSPTSTFFPACLKFISTAS